MGGREKQILGAARERGEPVPSEIQNRPELWPVLQPIWNAFWVLNDSRPIVSTGMGATYGPLPYADKSTYAKDHELAETIEELDDFLALIAVLDGEYLKLNAPRATRTRKPT